MKQLYATICLTFTPILTNKTHLMKFTRTSSAFLWNYNYLTEILKISTIIVQDQSVNITSSFLKRPYFKWLRSYELLTQSLNWLEKYLTVGIPLYHCKDWILLFVMISIIIKTTVVRPSLHSVLNQLIFPHSHPKFN